MPLKNGRPCGSVVADDSDECGYHLAHPVRPVPPPDPEPEDELPPAAQAGNGEPESAPGLALAPGQVRGQLASDLATDYQKMVTALREAMDADREVRITCRDCGKSNAYPVVDHRVRVEAAKTWTELGLGRARQEPDEEPPAELLEKPVGELSKEERGALTTHLAARYPEITARVRREAAEARAAVSEPVLPLFVRPPRRRPSGVS